MTGMPLARACFVGSTNAEVSVSAMAMPSAPLVIAESNALTISETSPVSEPVHCGVGMPNTDAASANPLRVGTKNEFVVTWLTNTKFHFGVLGKLPAPLAPVDDAVAPLHAASSMLAAATPPLAPSHLNVSRRD